MKLLPKLIKLAAIFFWCHFGQCGILREHTFRETVGESIVPRPITRVSLRKLVLVEMQVYCSPTWVLLQLTLRQVVLALRAKCDPCTGWL